ncbi:MAG: DUF368 domain-containing protein, partial [Clostridia bacterium]|nr:DUF368 domain-containing protein [Clostridia bacterium]
IPGVSGGTMAVVFGVYERIINLIANIRRDLKKELPFLLCFGAGALVGIFAFARAMGWVLENHPVEANAFFIGVILGSLPILIGFTFKVREEGKRRVHWRARVSNILPMLLTLGVMIAMFMVSDTYGADAKDAAKVAAKSVTRVGAFDLGQSLLSLVYGVIAVTTMIIPGISGSMVMLMIGFYETILTAVYTLNWPILLPFGLGCVIGLFTVAKLIKKLLSRFPHQTYSAILGFVIGSILFIFPGWTAMLALWPLVFMVLGIALITVFNMVTD